MKTYALIHLSQSATIKQFLKTNQPELSAIFYKIIIISTLSTKTSEKAVSTFHPALCDTLNVLTSHQFKY